VLKEKIKMELNQNDVVTMDIALSFKAGGIVKAGQLQSAAMNWLGEPLNRWVQERGIECEVLQVEGGGWQKGKIRFRMEFIPETAPALPQDPNSPLADLRSNLDI